MEEDEEVVLKNTGLYAHLQIAGFDDFETVEKTNSIPNNINSNSFTVKQQEKKHYSKEELEEFENLINLFLGSCLIFKDDVEFINNFLVDLKSHSSKTSVLRSDLFRISWQMATATIICYFGIRSGVRWKPQTLAIIQTLPLGFYFIHSLRFKYKRRKRENIAKILIQDLKDLSLLIQKCIQFIQDYEVIASFDVAAPERILTAEDTVAERQLSHLRETVFSTIRSIILELKARIISLTQKFPLNAAINEFSYHLAFLDESQLQCCDTHDSLSIQHLQKMKYVFLLLLSEFFRQLCLCLIPSLRTSMNEIPVSWIFDFLFSLKEKCSDLRSKLKAVFDFYYIYKRSEKAYRSKANIEWLYKEAYLKLCSVSLSLQNVLRYSRNLEEVLENIRSTEFKHEDIVNILDLKSEEIRKCYDQCKPVVDDFCRYVANLKPKATPQSIPVAPISSPSPLINKTNILLGVSDFNTHWPDEVFVAVSDSQTTETQAADTEDFVCNQTSKLLLSELKFALEGKAKEWKERERIALKNKNIDENFEENSSDIMNSCDPESKTSLHKEKCILVDPQIRMPINFNSESTFAKQIAFASASWGLQSEEFFDDSNNEESLTFD